MENITIDMNILKRFPDGFYKIFMHYYNDYDANVFTIVGVFEISGTGLKEF
jgi:hypothetical protein